MSQSDKKISLATATQWTQQWRDVESSYNSHNECNAFLIPIQDIQGVLAEMGPNPGDDACVRAYPGVDPSDNTEKLIIVGTQKDRTGVYRDMLPDAADGDGGSGNSIWDFTRPCPIYCDDSSALN